MIPVLPNGHEVRGQLDTGATRSIITRRLAEACRLNCLEKQTHLVLADNQSSRTKWVCEDVAFVSESPTVILKELVVVEWEMEVDFFIGKDLRKNLGFTISKVDSRDKVHCALERNENVSKSVACSAPGALVVIPTVTLRVWPGYPCGIDSIILKA